MSAAVVGRGHARRGEACADAVGTRCFGRYAAIAVLADGAGSAKYGVQAAHMAVNKTIEQLEDTIKSRKGCSINALKGAVRAVSSTLERQAARQGARIADYGTTLLVAYAQMRRNTLNYCIGHIGDGCVVAATETASVVLSEPCRGEHANETYFLTTQNVEERAHFACGTLDPSFGLILMSDGTASCLYDYKQRSPASGCCTISGWARRLRGTKLQRVINRNVGEVFTGHTNDDCSIALMKVIGIGRARR